MATFNTLARTLLMGPNFEPFKMLEAVARPNGQQPKPVTGQSDGDALRDTMSGASPPLTVGVIGAKGGVGASTLAFNLAVSLNDIFSDVTLVDADLQQPALAVLSAQEPVYTLSDLLTRGNNIEAGVFEACTYRIEGLKHSPRLLSPPSAGDGAFMFDLAQLPRLLHEIRALSKVWLVDLPKEIDRRLVELLDLCSEIVLVIEPNLASVASARRWLNNFEDLGYQPKNILIVVNRSGGKLREVESQLSGNFMRWTLVPVPNAYQELQQCCVSGKPLVSQRPNHPYTKALKVLALTLSERMKARSSENLVEV